MRDPAYSEEFERLNEAYELHFSMSAPSLTLENENKRLLSLLIESSKTSKGLAWLKLKLESRISGIEQKIHNLMSSSTDDLKLQISTIISNVQKLDKESLVLQTKTASLLWDTLSDEEKANQAEIIKRLLFKRLSTNEELIASPSRKYDGWHGSAVDTNSGIVQSLEFLYTHVQLSRADVSQVRALLDESKRRKASKSAFEVRSFLFGPHSRIDDPLLKPLLPYRFLGESQSKHSPPLFLGGSPFGLRYGEKRNIRDKISFLQTQGLELDLMAEVDHMATDLGPSAAIDVLENYATTLAQVGASPRLGEAISKGHLDKLFGSSKLSYWDSLRIAELRAGDQGLEGALSDNLDPESPRFRDSIEYLSRYYETSKYLRKSRNFLSLDQLQSIVQFLDPTLDYACELRDSCAADPRGRLIPPLFNVLERTLKHYKKEKPELSEGRQNQLSEIARSYEKFLLESLSPILSDEVIR